MAISGGDGSIILTTKVDQSGLNRGMTSMQNSVKSLSSSFKALGSTIAAVFSVTAIIRFSKQSGEFATQTEASVQRLIDIYGEAAQIVGDFIDENARAIGMSRSAGASIASTYGNLLSVWADQATNAELTNSLLNQTAVVASKTGRTTTDVAERIRSGLLGNTEAIEDLGINVNIKTIEITDAFKRIADGRSWEQLNAYEQSQVRTLAILEQSTKKYGTTVAETSATVRNQYQAAYEDFQNTWGQVVNTVLIPVLKVLTQVFNIATKGLQIIAGLSGKTIEAPKITSGGGGGFSGGGISSGGAPSATGSGGSGGSGAKRESAEEEQIDAEIKAIQDKIKALQKENKQINKNDKANRKANEKQLASFDDITTLGSNQMSEADAMIDKNNEEIDQLQEQLDLLREKKQAIQDVVSASDVGVGATGISGGVGGIGDLDLDYDNSFVGKISGDMAAIMAIVGGALVAVGLILFFYGHPFWGIEFIIAGAFVFDVSMATLSSSDQVSPISEKLMKILAIAGTALAALGLILLFGGVWKWGIAFLVAGASALNVAIVATKSGNVDKEAEEMLINVMMAAGAAMLALGVILLCFGVVSPLSIGLVVAGAASLAGAIALKPQLVLQRLSDFLKDNAGLIVGISLALLVLGIILCICGVITPLSIGLIVVGATGLVTEIVLNWNYTKNSVSNFLRENSGLIVGISLALLVLGIILCCVGVVTPLSIGLIVAGAVGLVTEIVLNWDNVFNSISTFLTNNSGLIVGVSIALLILGIILCCVGVITPLSIGLIAAGAVGLAAEIALNWEYITTSISDFIKNNSELIIGVATALVIIGVILLLTGVGIPLAVGLIVAGGAVLAAELVLNWDYISNKITAFIENNSKLIVGISLALVILGIILLFTGVGIPLAIGLIVAGGGALATEVTLNWNFIVDKVKEVWDNIKLFWNENIAPVFTAEWWETLGKNCINGLIAGFEGGINGIIGAFEKMINWIVNGLNEISFDVPDWVPGIGDKTFGFNLQQVKFDRVSIPRLAQGSVIPPNREFLAVLGDNKREHEIVSPLSTMKQAFAEAMIEMGGNFGSGNTEVVLEIDGREFGRAVVEQGNRENRRIGTRLVIM